MLKKIAEHKVTRHTQRMLYLALSLLLFIVLPIVVFTMSTGNSKAIFGMRSFIILTGSMEPTIPVGSVVYVKTAPTYDVGDIIAFTNKSGQTVTHRLAGTETKNNIKYLKTKGDANKSEDADLLTQDKVIGKTVLSVPYIGRIIAFFKTVPGFVTLIVVPTVLFVLFELWNIKKEIEKSVEKRVLERMQQGS